MFFRFTIIFIGTFIPKLKSRQHTTASCSIRMAHRARLMQTSWLIKCLCFSSRCWFSKGTPQIQTCPSCNWHTISLTLETNKHIFMFTIILIGTLIPKLKSRQHTTVSYTVRMAHHPAHGSCRLHNWSGICAFFVEMLIFKDWTREFEMHFSTLIIDHCSRPLGHQDQAKQLFLSVRLFQNWKVGSILQPSALLEWRTAAHGSCRLRDWSGVCAFFVEMLIFKDWPREFEARGSANCLLVKLWPLAFWILCQKIWHF